MGCDIHVFIDYDDFKAGDGRWWVSSFARKVDFGRYYALFALMAGVRHDPLRDAFEPLFEPRGLPDPDRVSYVVEWEYTLRVTAKEELFDAEGWCSETEAKEWVERGDSTWINDEHTRISHPDWHSASWLNADELEQVIEAYEQIEFPESSWVQYNSPENQPIPENATAAKMPRRFSGGYKWYVEVGEKRTVFAPVTIKAILAAMREIDGEQVGRSRLVFWFDN